MECVHRGRQVAKYRRCCGKEAGGQFLCGLHKFCTLEDDKFVIQDGTGRPMANCETCQDFEAAVSDTEKAFNNRPWGSGETVSGPGSTLAATKVIREAIPGLMEELRANSMLDIPCGDCNWMSSVWPEQCSSSGYPHSGSFTTTGHYVANGDKLVRDWSYIGADIVRGLLERNREKYQPAQHDVDFRHLDLITDDLPKADVVFTRDCLVHLPYHEIGQALKNIVKSGAKWLVATHFPGRTNHEIPLGAWRPLDLTAAPFYLPEPMQVINEGLAGDFSDKSLGVWSIDAIRDAVAQLNARPKLTIGMAAYRDWPGVWATLESIWEGHPEVRRQIELIVVDNDLEGQPNRHSEDEHSNKCKRHVEALGGRYDHFTAVQGTAAAKGRIFELATAPNVLVVDCHVILPAGTLRKLIEYFDANPDTKDLLQGPVISAGQVLATHFAPRWGSMMFGQWATDHAKLKAGEPFEIPMQGCGLFACRKEAWPGFHPLLRGFGPEEGHIHARVRNAGGKCLCLPWLKWSHRFGNAGGVSPQASNEERLRGHLITWLDTEELCLSEIRKHFTEDLQPNGRPAMTHHQFDAVLAKTRDEFGDRTIRGLGDRIERVFEATGIARVAKAVLGDDCGCPQNREFINRTVG